MQNGTKQKYKTLCPGNPTLDMHLSRWKGDICHPGWVAIPQPQWVQSFSEFVFLKFMFSRKATKIDKIFTVNLTVTKGQTNLKWFFQADISSEKWMNKFNFTTCRLVFVRFLEESEDTKKTFWNYLTFRYILSNLQWRFCQFLWPSQKTRTFKWLSFWH